MTKYEEALNSLASKLSGAEGFTNIDDLADVIVLQEALRKAKDLDTLIEARRKATKGEWEFINDEKISFGQRVNGLGVGDVVFRISNKVTQKPLTAEDISNGQFITTAANITEKWR